MPTSIDADLTLSGVRAEARNHLRKIPLGGLTTASEDGQFELFAGPAPSQFKSRQKQMEASNYQMTFCNEFAGEVARAVIKTYVGAIDLRQFVLSGDRSHAWIDSSSGAQPQYGDIYYCTVPHQHLGVSRSVKDGMHRMVQAGHGGKVLKQDILKFTSQPWNAKEFAGWIDIEIFKAGPKAAATYLSPVGKWTVWGQNRRFRWTYNFSDKYVTWTDDFNGMSGRGQWKVDSKHLVIIWDSHSVDLWNLPVDYKGMKGIEDMKEEGHMDIEAIKQ